MHIRPHEKLIVWQEAHRLCLMVYRLTKSFPPDERFGLTSQMRRSASNVPTNIAEGNTRRTKKDKCHFFDFSISSLEELHYECLLSRDLSYLASDQFLTLDQQINRVSYLLTQLHISLR
jgi:four helix bundle protein